MKTHFAKRHYETIAAAAQEAIKSATSSTEVAGVWNAIGKMADMFARDNPKFDRERFMRACEPGANIKAKKAA